MALTPEQKQVLKKLSEDLKKYEDEVRSGKHADLPNSKRGRMEYKIKHGIPLDQPLPNELIFPAATEND